VQDELREIRDRRGEVQAFEIHEATELLAVEEDVGRPEVAVAQHGRGKAVEGTASRADFRQRDR
jgi:hypothetical protein